jgi:hypothetical protein
MVSSQVRSTRGGTVGGHRSGKDPQNRGDQRAGRECEDGGEGRGGKPDAKAEGWIHELLEVLPVATKAPDYVAIIERGVSCARCCAQLCHVSSSGNESMQSGVCQMCTAPE